MKHHMCILVSMLQHKMTLGLVVSLLFISCTISKEAKLIDRTAVQETRTNAPVNESEIRELQFNSHPEKVGHKDLRINGQLFTKKVVDGAAEIKPCGGCVVMLTTPSDSSVKVNMTTEKDGFFSFHGQAVNYSVLINNPGFNRIKIGNVSFETGGVTTFKIINAAGSGTDNFIVVKNGPDYTWTKSQ